MEYPMRTYGLTLYERILEDLLTITALLLLCLSGTALFFRPALGIIHVTDGIRIGMTAFAGLLCWLGGAGVRQNHPVSRLALGLMILAGIWWLVGGLVTPSGWWVGYGVCCLVLAGMLWVLFRRATRARFKPRFFSVRQFETLVYVSEAVLDSDGEAALSPIQVAISTDHYMARFDSPVKNDIQLALFLLEWLLPFLTTFRPFPFSMLGSTARRRVIERIIGKRGPMGAYRDIARSVKMLTCAGYYGSPEGMAQVGYVPFDERPRSIGANQQPLQHPDPFLTEQPTL